MTVIERKETARAHVAAIRARTVCAHCGKQPIHWHNAEHPQEPRRRISTMAGEGRTIEEIDAEIAACTALCPKCHIHEDRMSVRGQWTVLTPVSATVVKVKQTQLRFTPEELAMIDGLAKANHLSRSAMMRVLIAKADRELQRERDANQDSEDAAS